MTPRRGGPKRLGEILERLPSLPRLSAARGLERIERAWAAAAGPATARVSRPERLAGGILTVLVQGSAWLQELRGFKAEEIRRRLRDLSGLPVDRIRFCLASP